MNKEKLQSYNNRLNTNNLSLETVLETINTLPELKDPTLQDKYIEITENGTQSVICDEGYDGLNKVDINVNVESGGGGEITPLAFADIYNEILKHEYDIVDRLVMSTNNAVHTNEKLTLYTPNETYKHYIIRKRETGYSIVWFQPCIFKSLATNSLNPHLLRFSSGYNIFNGEKSQTLNADITSVPVYTSTTMSFEECVNAIQNSSTSYNTGKGSNWGSLPEDGYIVAYTNLPCLDSNNNLMPIRKLSSDETIEVIK